MSIAPLPSGLFARVALTTAICLSAGCSFASLDELQEGSGGAAGASTASSTNGATASSASSAGASTSTASTATSTTTGGDQGGGGGGGAGQGGAGGGGGLDIPPPDLADTGLLARYFIDEAGSGDASGNLEDAATNPVLLSIVDPDDVMQFVTEGGHRGLVWDVAGVRGVASQSVTGTKYASLNNTVHGTIEVVARIDQASVYGSRLMHIGTSSESSFTIAISHPGPAETTQIAPPTRLEMRTHGHGDPAIYRYAFFDVDLVGERVVIHAVYDSQEPAEEDRQRMYVNGVRVERNTDDLEQRPLLDEQLFIGEDDGVTLGNRDIGDRSIEGSIFYAAMYRAPLSAEEIAGNAAELLRTDDR